VRKEKFWFNREKSLGMLLPQRKKLGKRVGCRDRGGENSAPIPKKRGGGGKRAGTKKKGLSLMEEACTH